MENPDHNYQLQLLEDFLFDQDDDGEQEESFHLTETPLAQALQLQEVLFSQISLNTQKSSTFEGQSSRSFFCEICQEHKGLDQTVTIPTCRHSFCVHCINTYIKMKVVNDKVGQVSCAGINCETLLELDNFRAVVTKDVVDLWEEALCREQIIESHRFYCPFESCSVMLVNDGEEDRDHEEIRESECPNCHRLFCAHCRVPWHFGISCEELQELKKKGEKYSRDDLLFKKLAEEEKWKLCPRCRFYVERKEGCIHMTCRCKFEFCYGCGEAWSDDHFDNCAVPDDDDDDDDDEAEEG